MIRKAIEAPGGTPRKRLPLREGLLLLGFVLLLGAAVVSVVVPELGRDPTQDPASGGAAGAGVTPR